MNDPTIKQATLQYLSGLDAATPDLLGGFLVVVGSYRYGFD